MSVIGKPTVSPDPRMGFVCHGDGVEGHGMTEAAAYASWEQRWLRQRADLPTAQHYSPWVAPNVEGKPFSPEPL